MLLSLLQCPSHTAFVINVMYTDFIYILYLYMFHTYLLFLSLSVLCSTNSALQEMFVLWLLESRLNKNGINYVTLILQNVISNAKKCCSKLYPGHG